MSKKGFTVIELLIVLSVVAILIGVALPRFQGMQQEANVTKANAELRVLQTAIDSYYMNQTPNAFPATSTAICSTTLNSVNPLIVSEVLYDPFRTAALAEYRYVRSDNGLYYVLFSYGPDGAADITGISDAGVLAGTDDDDLYVTNGTGFES